MERPVSLGGRLAGPFSPLLTLHEGTMTNLGEHIAEQYLDAKRQEWAEYLSHVHPWEQDRYLHEY